MRIGFVIQQLGVLLLLLSAAMLPSAAWAAYDHIFVPSMAGEDKAGLALLASALFSAMLGLAVFRRGRSNDKQLGRREALLLVSLGWVVGAALSAAPYRVWAAMHTFPDGTEHPFQSVVNCYFEAMSGLTTTGASVLTDIEAIPRSLLLWRAFTQWLGGLGIVVLFVAVLPILGVGGKRLFRFEAPGPKKEGVRPRIRAAAQVLWIIYLGITVAEILALKLAGLSWFDSMAHSFATLATGGFSTQNASITGFGLPVVEVIIIVFMMMAGVNFALYDQILARRWRDVLRNPELRVYLTIILVATILITFMVADTGVVDINGNSDSGFWATLRHSLFTTVSMQTTTGFGTADFNQWALPAKMLLVTLMFVGGCGGSTGGGIKVIRFIILAKVLWAEIEAVFRPNVVRTIRVGSSAIDAQMRSATLVYFLLIATIVVVATGLVLWLETPQKITDLGGNPATTAFTAVVATLNNIGPGLDLVGVTKNYAWMETPTKVLLCVAMVLGRLELYAFLVLLVPRFWKEE